jgi:hypothetical protein
MPRAFVLLARIAAPLVAALAIAGAAVGADAPPMPESLHPSNETQRYFPILRDRQGAPSICLRVHALGWRPALSDSDVRLASRGWSAEQVRSYPELVMGAFADALGAGQLDAVLALYENGAGQAEATRRFGASMDDIVAFRKGARWSIIQEARFGSYAVVLWDTQTAGGAEIPWVEYLHHGPDGWRLTAKLGDFHLARLLLDALTEAMERGDNQPCDPPPHDVAITFDDATGAPRLGMDGPDALHLASAVTIYPQPMLLESYQGHEDGLVFLQQLHRAYAVGRPVAEINAFWQVGANQALRPDAAIPVLGWCDQRQVADAGMHPMPTSVLGSIGTPCGTAYVLSEGAHGTVLFVDASHTPTKVSITLVGDRYVAVNRLFTGIDTIPALFH